MIITWALDLSQSPQSTQRKIKKLCDLCGLCEITRKCLQLSKFLMAEIRTNPGNALKTDMDFVRLTPVYCTFGYFGIQHVFSEHEMRN